MANINDKLSKIITSVFGKDVRQALYDGLDTVNKETENTTSKQQHLEETFDQLVINSGNSNAEIVDARVDKNSGKSYSKVGDRMDEVSSQLDRKASESDLIVERRRIDTFVSLPNGSTTADAELIDARIGGNGIPYSNVGSAIRGQFNNLKSSLGEYFIQEITMTTGRNINLAVGVGNTVDLTPEVISGYRYAIVNCKEDDIFTINGTGGDNPRLWGFVDSNNVLLEVSNVNATATNLILTAPKNASKLIINDLKTDGVSYNSNVGSSIGGQFNNLKSSLGEYFTQEITMTTGRNINLAVGVGNTVDLTPEVISGYRYAIVNCKEDDIFTINGTGGDNPRLWGFVDSNNVLLEVSNVNATETNLILTAPKNASKLIINNSTTRFSYKGRDLSEIGYLNKIMFEKNEKEIEDLKKKVNKTEIRMTNNYYIALGDVGVGNAVDMELSYLNRYRYAIINCEENDVFTINGLGGDNPRLWGFVDSNNILLEVADVNLNGNDLIITAPLKANRLIINDLKTGGINYIGVGLLNNAIEVIEQISEITDKTEENTKKTIELTEELADTNGKITKLDISVISAKDFVIGTGTPDFNSQLEGVIKIPCWGLSKAEIEQSITGYMNQLAGDYEGIKINIIISNPNESVEKESYEVFQALISSVSYGENIKTYSKLTKTVRHKTNQKGIIEKISFKDLVRTNTLNPFILTLYRKDKDKEDTNKNTINIIAVEIIPIKPITIQKPNKYSAWPFISNVGEKLVCVYSRGLTHIDGKTPSIYRRNSVDGGMSWSSEKQIVNTPNTRDTITGKGKDNNGNMLMWVRKGGPGGQDTKHNIYRTNDGEIFDEISKPIFDIVPSHIGDIFEVPTVGLFAFYNTVGTNRSWGVVISTDNGITWTQKEIETGLTTLECPMEISGVYLNDGKILAIGRKETSLPNREFSMFQIQSSDFGVTWTKEDTNINDIALSTPSLIYDETKNLLSLYYFERGVGILKVRKATPSDIWNKPLNWEIPEEIGFGTTNFLDTGNANAVAYGNEHIVTYYSGEGTSTGIYATIVEQ